MERKLEQSEDKLHFVSLKNTGRNSEIPSSLSTPTSTNWYTLAVEHYPPVQKQFFKRIGNQLQYQQHGLALNLAIDLTVAV